MIIRRMRARVGLYLSWIGLFVGISLTAYATQPVTESQMKAFVFEVLGAAAVLVIGSGGGMMAWILARDRDLQRENLAQFKVALGEIASGMHAAIRALEEHNLSPYSHGPASDYNHGPMDERSERIEQKLDQLILEHSVIRGQDDEICRFVRTAAASARNPKDSPKPKRSTDSGTDYTALRGKP